MNFGPHSNFIFMSYAVVLVSLGGLALVSWLRLRKVRDKS